MTTVSSNTFSPSLMNTINSKTSTASTSTAGSTDAASQTSAAKMSADFMTMLIAQMKNQDPTQPMTSQDMTNSLAQINTVNGINQLNTTMSNHGWKSIFSVRITRLLVNNSLSQVYSGV